MDKKNILPQQGQPVVRMTSGKLPSYLAELSEEALGDAGAGASWVTSVDASWVTSVDAAWVTSVDAAWVTSVDAAWVTSVDEG